MSFATFSEYLAAGKFVLSTPPDEYERRKKESGARAVFEYVCPDGHVSTSAISSFKNKKAKHKNNFDGFCAKCKANPIHVDIPQPCLKEGVEEPVIPSVEMEPQIDAPETDTEHEEPETVIEEEQSLECDLSSLPAFAHRADTLQHPFFENYNKRRPHLWQQFRTTGDAVINSSCPYIGTAIRWLTSTKNIVNKRYVAEKDIRATNLVPMFNTLSVPTLDLAVAIVPTLVYNLNPTYFFARCKNITTSILAVLLVNGGDIVDVWYIIPGKKLFSVVHRHAVDPETPVSVDQSLDETEYFCFEQAVFGLETENR